jgi:predicted DNA-binding transcriptional regulator AlpA
MTVHEFGIVLNGMAQDRGEAVADALYGRGFDDAILSTRDGITRLAFDRQADSLLQAVLSAIQDVETALAGSGVRIARIEPDDLVSIQDIAQVVGVTRQHVHLLVKGDRGSGTFPAPVLTTSRRRFWRWPDVLDWLQEHGDPVAPEIQGLFGEFRERQRILVAINAALDLRRTAGDQAVPILESLGL